MQGSGDHNARIACVTCTPMAKVTGPNGDLIYDPVSPLWHRARMGLSYGTNVNTVEICVDGLEVGDARSRVAARCLEMKPRPYFLFFLDSDVIVSNDSFLKLFYHLKTKPSVDIACGIYVCKGAAPYDPLIYEGDGFGAFWDFAVGDILTTKQHGITACHMGLTLIRVDLFQRMLDAGVVHGDGTDQEDEPFFCTQNFKRERPDGSVETFKGTEDIFFAQKARQIGAEFLVDSSVLAGHHDKSTGLTYGLPGNTSPIERAKWLPLPDGSGLRKDRREADEEGLLLAIDLGAGESRREWPGHRTYTLDAYRASGADYIQEMENLNLPSDHYDLCASRHAFEHVGRWAQEKLWAETFRITRPGGKLEVIVPSLQWAAEKIVAGNVDFATLNVLFGSQEIEEGWGKDGNHHLFGYTKEVAQALAEGAGWVDVACKDWRDDPSMDYHMIITARKPAPGEVTAKKAAPHEESTPAAPASRLSTEGPTAHANGNGRPQRKRAAARKGR